MKLIFAVYDLKAEAYGNPMFFTARGLAVRGFTDAAKDPQSPLAQHPGDFALHELGTYDASSGEFKSHSVPKFVVSAASAVAEAVKNIGLP